MRLSTKCCYFKGRVVNPVPVSEVCRPAIIGTHFTLDLVIWGKSSFREWGRFVRELVGMLVDEQEIGRPSR